jgi:thioredoxin 2
MKLDHTGILVSCTSCGTTNRLPFAALDKATKCGKCQTALPFLTKPIDVPSTQLFDAAVSTASVPIVVDFWAAWCGPCRMVAPEIAKVAERLAGRALVLKVDTDAGANAELSQRFGIRSIPTIAVFRDGREVNRVSGVRPADAIAALIPPLAA